MRAWYDGTFAALVHADTHAIAAELALAAASRRLDPNPESADAWSASVEDLKRAAQQLAAQLPSSTGWHYFLEFEVPRRARRIDVAIVAEDVIFLLEWKVGASRFDRAAMWQIEQYALDMRDFHEGSRGRTLIPVLVATEAQDRVATEPLHFDATRRAQEVQTCTPEHLASLLDASWNATHKAASVPLESLAWEDSAYRPTPTIIEAATMLYEKHDVRELALSGAQNLDTTVTAVLDLIEMCRAENRRGIAFITGAPGSGTTLAGLQVVHAPELMGRGDATGVFLSGNMPLVEVIRTALSDSAAARGGTKRDAQREVSTFIQDAYVFRNEYARGGTPPEHVVLFDEAQRAWDRKRVHSWTRGALDHSEPEILLDVMNRLDSWAVVIAMVGSGQEINSGEAGLGEWGRALQESHPNWLVRASPAVLPGAQPPPGGRLFDTLPETGPAITPDSRLHLQMNVRSPRAERLNQWVDALLDLRIDDARRALPDGHEYPMVMTRSLDAARAWLRDHNDEDQRMGLVASADARRLRAWGLDTRSLRQERSWADWFLRPRGDVRGSNQLEVVATNFDCQGLELDWAGVCWGNDAVGSPKAHEWRVRRFTGTKWQNTTGERRQFILNGYRVVLTRARRGQVIWVPQPDGTDSTLRPEDFDNIAALLTATGLPTLD